MLNVNARRNNERINNIILDYCCTGNLLGIVTGTSMFNMNCLNLHVIRFKSYFSLNNYFVLSISPM